MSTTEMGHYEEPAADKRVYYRHRDTGEMAYLVRFGEKAKLRMNRPGEVILRNLSDQWYLDEDFGLRLEPMQRAIVAFETDKAACKMLGLVTLSRRDWSKLRDLERIAWMQNGPSPTGDTVRDGVRMSLWKSVMNVLGRLK